jgi:hypothetical protein
MISHNISYIEVYKSVWLVIDAVNKHPRFNISYPSSRAKQHAIARGFRKRSKAGFLSNCWGCIDGALICMEKPSEKDCKEACIDRRKFFCARKHQYGSNMQAVCDADRRFLDVSIRNPAAALGVRGFATR